MPRAPRPSPSRPAQAQPRAWQEPQSSSPEPFHYPSKSSAADFTAKQASRITRQRAIALTCLSLTGGLVAFYSVSLYITTTRSSANPNFQGPTTQSELTSVYDRTANSFDTDVGLSERLMGITTLRQGLAGQCRGDVLEVSAGTARNLGYYRFGEHKVGKGIVQGVRSLTLVDLSQEMVEVGQRKWNVLKGTGGLQGWKDVPVRFLKADVRSRMPGPPVMEVKIEDQEVGDKAQQTQAVVVSREGGQRQYDFILQTMGLCSTDAPVELLQNLSLHLNTSNPDARILLLEHGQSYFDWLNRILDNQAPAHADQHGCWWNRDIGDIVRKSGLEVVRKKRKHFGTTWLYELKPGKQLTEASKAKAITPSGDGTAIKESATGWGSWLPRWTYEKICRR